MSDPLTILTTALIGSKVGPTIIDAIAALLKKIDRTGPAVLGEGKNLRLNDPDRRLSWGITKKAGSFAISVLVEKSDGWALQKAKELEASYPGTVTYSVTGIAQSLWPTEISGHVAPVLPGEPVLMPGVSVGHFTGYAGSLGCFVIVRDKQRSWPGFTSASHVLAKNNNAKRDDAILQPGHPDGKRVLKNKIGTLQNFTFLAHHSRVDEVDQTFNTVDIAIVKMDEPELTPEFNFVPAPNRPGEVLKLKGVVASDAMFERIAEPVFKFGRTTGLTEGILEHINLSPYPIRLPDGRKYLYSEIAAVRRKDSTSFSAPGDSGAVVYTADGLALGFVIGASDDHTFIAPATRCLEAMDAELIT